MINFKLNFIKLYNGNASIQQNNFPFLLRTSKFYHLKPNLNIL
jgi:hypothetical protein